MRPCVNGRSIQGLLAKVEDDMLCAVTFVIKGFMLEHFKGRKKACSGQQWEIIELVNCLFININYNVF